MKLEELNGWVMLSIGISMAVIPLLLVNWFIFKDFDLLGKSIWWLAFILPIGGLFGWSIISSAFVCVAGICKLRAGNVG